jgi:hypothetical protein
MNAIIARSTAGSGGARRRVGESGTTLAEVVIALGVAGLAVMGCVNGYMFCGASAEKSALSLSASTRAVERLEQTRAATWSPSSYPPVDQLNQTNFPNEIVTLDLPSAKGVTTLATNFTQISQISTNPALRRIHVDCVWSYFGSALLFTNSVETCRAPDQ